MNPTTIRFAGFVELQNKLIEVEVVLYPLSDCVVIVTNHLEVYRLTLTMLAGGLAAYFFTQELASIAARDYHRGVELTSGRFKHVLAQRSEGFDMGFCGGVVQSKPGRGLTLGHLLQSKVGCDSPFGGGWFTRRSYYFFPRILINLFAPLTPNELVTAMNKRY